MNITITDAINNSLFFFGAGASYDSGCKLSSGMLEDLKRKISSSDNETFNKPEKEALKFLLSCLEYHSEWRTLETSENFKFTPNIEELALLIRRVKNRENFLPYPITGNWADKLVLLESEFDSLPESDKQADTLFGSLDRIIKSRLLREWLEPSNLEFLNPLKEFFQSYPSTNFRMDIFSLNNDMVLEKYFTDNQINPWRGFVSGEWRGFEEENIPEDYGRINLYKLHGSLDWVRLDSGEFKEKDKLVPEDEQYIEQEHNPYVIFGQGTKTFSVEPFFSLLQQFQKKLKEKSYIFVIGYSFFDPYINNLLIKAVNGDSKKLIIINPFFGPEKLKTETKDGFKFLYDDFFLKIKYPQNITAVDLAKYIQEIQENSFYSEMPEFNIKQVNANSLELLPVGMKTFLETYFKNGGEVFTNFITEYESKRAEEYPF
ncbi:MAG: SIR2 family protein [Saprospiraceae bacterium]|uniref:SIR2 family protein n=1 Tax=Candidatus Defluviibacterium haderslevense TaxID=2981993 RepID=A0A9D7S657_9BACT|nr:SIR2 family protein [Candidatus Defluviibacterium haderslevense]MBK9716086.1 SIR2 family protein [Candidatus Defluviibacterium haderslevense]MBL0238413.1 SIR2 family protein [Candidatus Defluviibacterium haderslevense]